MTTLLSVPLTFSSGQYNTLSSLSALSLSSAATTLPLLSVFSLSLLGFQDVSKRNVM
uniref:Uncharacterized protein n=1 Tax=Nelumbo nucifera TaxID=4432 RepID=A0A822XXB5_NELNU|nr:TPA_asm: hypothetical protein HUJ06_025232 [Nelumbo nucifera]